MSFDIPKVNQSELRLDNATRFLSEIRNCFIHNGRIVLEEHAPASPQGGVAAPCPVSPVAGSPAQQATLMEPLRLYPVNPANLPDASTIFNCLVGLKDLKAQPGQTLTLTPVGTVNLPQAWRMELAEGTGGRLPSAADTPSSSTHSD